MRSLPLSQFFIALFALLILLTSLTQYGGVSEFGAGFLPTVLSGLLLLFTLIDGAIHYRQQHHGRFPITAAEVRALLMIGVSVIVFILLIETLGFILCATLLLFSLIMIRRRDKLWLWLLFSAAAAFGIHYVFASVLMVALPSGIWS
ncbi:tripartite tricarboxylate transporter TctB family protein [Vibrio quintilis]|uniref:Tripartite tricarboxylate transporter TctB family protein n=1 Tax=Vibrio quintilis TaxID=1117707 RepID=A0A1M7YUK4_9VIBR|nr:tripartite tricarboxylate transporter TctB family protein [Vibrio quintilis]SHO56319.1 Tripartite tricarboxylate transporter TctB family protein [Vibrio quintilis]